MQEQVLAVSLAAVAAVAAVFAKVLRELQPGEAGWSAAEAAAKLRARLLWGSLVMGAAIALLTLVPWPHAVATGPEVVSVTVRARLWAWELEPARVPANTPVVFLATSEDVNHGFGVFDLQGRLLFQTQAMPGWVNKVSWTFAEPGRYRILCLEYCGLVHHGMIAELDVVPKG